MLTQPERSAAPSRAVIIRPGFIILGTLIQNVDVNILEGFEPDFRPELSLNPGERGMQMKVRFRDGAPALEDRVPRRSVRARRPVATVD